MKQSDPISQLVKAKGSHKLPRSVRKHFSDESLEVLEHFGMNTPHILNEYCCTLEDALIESLSKIRDLQAQLEEHEIGLYNEQVV